MASLRSLGLLDSPSERRFDRIVELVGTLLDVPIALISLIDEDRQWFKARIGLDAAETGRDVAFCAHAIVGADDLFIVGDASQDERFADNPLVTGDPLIRFYAGHVLHDTAGLALGTLCAIDRRPRQFSDVERRTLRLLAEMVEAEIQREGERDLLLALSQSEQQNRIILDTLAEGLVLQDLTGRIVRWNPAAETVLGLTASQLSGRTSMGDCRIFGVTESGSVICCWGRFGLRT